MSADSLAENTPNAQICLPKTKSSGFQRKKWLHWESGVRSPWAKLNANQLGCFQKVLAETFCEKCCDKTLTEPYIVTLCKQNTLDTYIQNTYEIVFWWWQNTICPQLRKLFVRGGSQTTLTKFWLFLTPYPLR